MRDPRQPRAGTALLLTLALAGVGRPAAAGAAPELRFVAAGEQQALADRLAKQDPAALRRIAELVGLDDAGPPIPVHLVAEGSLAARRAPSWSVAYATDGGQVVLVPSRVPAYPYTHLDTVLRHEVAHVLIERAARGGAVPRWFHEGLALYAARDWGLEDRSRLLWATLREGDPALARLDDLFAAGANSAARAYAFSGAFVRFLIERDGRRAPAAILAGVAAGAPFAEAFRTATGSSLEATEAAFIHHLDVWNRWVPILSSSATLWILITVLALIAFARRRARDEKMRERWAAEEEAAWLAEAPTNEWIH